MQLGSTVMDELRLEIGALRDLVGDGADALPILRANGGAPSIQLTLSGVDVALSPGAYFFELNARAVEGVLRPRVEARAFGGAVTVVDFVEAAAGRWRGVLNAPSSIQQVTLGLPDVVAVIVGQISVFVEPPVTSPDLTLRGTAVSFARAGFRKLPQSLRRFLLASRQRRQWLADLRDGAAHEESPAQRSHVIASADGSDALRADFENRFSVALGTTRQRVPDEPMGTLQSDVKLIAFHLPQFHRIPENDAWWGNGFTEWTNVAKAVPQFVGHHQPRLPGELGFYDLRTPGLLAQQAALAKQFGIAAFCFHYYWFAGKRLLETPIENFLSDRSIDIEFCLCWANESWTRRWDGGSNDVLIAQDYGVEQLERVFEDFARHMEDPRYLRVDGKPLLVVYRPAVIDAARSMTERWRGLAQRRGWPGIYLVASNAFAFGDYAALGFDALVEFPPHGFVANRIDSRLDWLNTSHSGSVFDYGAVARTEALGLQRDAARRQGKVLPGVMPSWDNEARRPGAGTIYHGSTPAAYEDWLRAAVTYARDALPLNERMVFINAWNEWAEGAYLEPDRAFGTGYLAATRKALNPP